MDSESKIIESKKEYFNIPSEYRLSLKWENAIKKFGTNVGVGSAVAGIASIVVFRKYLFTLLNRAVSAFIFVNLT